MPEFNSRFYNINDGPGGSDVAMYLPPPLALPPPLPPPPPPPLPPPVLLFLKLLKLSVFIGLQKFTATVYICDYRLHI